MAGYQYQESTGTHSSLKCRLKRLSWQQMDQEDRLEKMMSVIRRGLGKIKLERQQGRSRSGLVSGSQYLDRVGAGSELNQQVICLVNLKTAVPSQSQRQVLPRARWSASLDNSQAPSH